MGKIVLQADEFYIKNPNSGRYFTMAGLQFISELLSKAVAEAKLDPAKILMGIDRTYTHQNGPLTPTIWIAYPSISTKLVSNLFVEDGRLKFYTRKGGWGSTTELLLADPDVFKLLGNILTENLPKNSKFAL